MGFSFVLLFKSYDKGNYSMFYPLLAVYFIFYLLYYSVSTYCEVCTREKTSQALREYCRDNLFNGVNILTFNCIYLLNRHVIT